MEVLFYVLATVVRLILGAVLMAMLLRSLWPFFGDEDSKFFSFLLLVTEPFVVPVRLLMEKFNILQDSPIDFAYTITSVIICVILAFI